MTSKQLMQSILQLAISGKLVEQRPEEGTAEELYTQIQEEKARLIKEKKIKKEKPLPSITDEEIPFEIPENWKWVRIGNISSSCIGLTYKPSDENETGVPVLRSGNIQNGKIDLSQDLKRLQLNQVDEKYYLHKNDILICARNGSKALVGKNALIRDLEEQCVFGAFMAKITSICNPYLKYYLDSSYFKKLLDSVNTTTINQITQKNLTGTIVPLPPLSEQKRIVAKIEELKPLVEAYGNAYAKLENLDLNFKDQIRKSILQYAIQGKLVEQRPEEGTAEELFTQIQEEKARLIKEKKIKKEKPLPSITDEEIPFEIPESWKWSRFGSLTNYTDKKTKVLPNQCDKSTWCLDLEDIEKETGIVLNKVTLKDREPVGDKVKFERGEILYSKLRPYLKKILIAEDNGICSSEIVPFHSYCKSNTKYLMYFLKSSYADTVINGASYGVKMPRVNPETMANLPIPLPPLSEQKRIVAKIEELFALCDDLK